MITVNQGKLLQFSAVPEAAFAAKKPLAWPGGALTALIADETARFLQAHPKSAALAQASKGVWRGGTPMHWMGDWASPTPIFVRKAKGARLTCVDGIAYDDFCLGDTAAMFGHGIATVALAIAGQAAKGASFMLPTDEGLEVGRLLAERFGLPIWQATTTASEANRAAIRWARAVTGRPKIVIFDGAYHGAVDEAFVSLETGSLAMRRGLVGQVQDLTASATAVPFNDVAALEAALSGGDAAAVLAEPVMTNCGMILPDPGFHDALRAATRRHGTLLILDETHTLSTGPGGYSRAYGLEPDVLVIGKAIGGGVPAAVWGVTAELSGRMDAAALRAGPGHSGMGTTLSGSAMAMAAMHAMLSEVMTPKAYGSMLAGATRLAKGLETVIAQAGAPWSVVAAGGRVELVFARPVPRNAAQMRRALDHQLLQGLHLYLINRGMLIAPFHNMMLISPVTQAAQINRLVRAVDGFACAVAS